MKIKLIFPNSKEYSNKYFINIKKNKIDYYKGLYPLDFDYFNEREDKLIKINKTFDIYKLDIEELNADVTHQIVSQKLHETLKAYEYYIKINLLQEIYINWHQKKYLLQSNDMKKDILKYFIGGFLGFLGSYILQEIKAYRNAPVKPPTTEIQKSLEQK